MIVHHQVTEHRSQLFIREDAPDPQEYVEVCIASSDGEELPVYLSLTPAEARTFADALLSSSQRVYDRQPHGNS